MNTNEHWDTKWVNEINCQDLELYPIQFANTKRLEKNDVVYIFDETGAGKTISAGLMALHYMSNHPGKSVLVITIPVLTRSRKFENDWYGKLPFTDEEKSRVIFVNNHCRNLEKLVEVNQRWGLIIIDEAHEFLEAKMRREALFKLRSDKLVFLTATPIKRGSYNLSDYCEMADCILEPKKADRKWLDEMKNMNLSRMFDAGFPITRYFKDTTCALEKAPLEHADDYKLVFDKNTIVRKQPEIWEYDGEEDKIKALSENIISIREIDTDGPQSRFIIFVRLIKDESDVITRWLNEHSDLYCDYDNRNEKNNRLTYCAVNGSSSHYIREFMHNGENGKELPDILIITYKIAEAGVDLPGYNYVINYHIPAFPSSLEQRFGRVDRMGKKNPSLFPNIYCVYLLPKKDWNTSKLNFYNAMILYLDSLLTEIPARNILITQAMLDVLLKEKAEAKKHIDYLAEKAEELLSEDNVDEIRRYLFDSESADDVDRDLVEILELCNLDDSIIQDSVDLDQMKRFIERRRREFGSSKTDEVLADAKKILIDDIGDSIFRIDDSKGGIEFKCALECAKEMYFDSGKYKEYEKEFNEMIKLPLMINNAWEKYKNQIEDYFEEQFIAQKKGWKITYNKENKKVEVVADDNLAVGNFHNIFTADYSELLKNKVLKGLDNEETALLIKYCTKERIMSLPFFEMGKRFGELISNDLVTDKNCGLNTYIESGVLRRKKNFDHNVFTTAQFRLMNEGLVAKKIASLTPKFATYKIPYRGYYATFESSNWLKLAFHVIENQKDGIMDAIIEKTGRIRDFTTEFDDFYSIVYHHDFDETLWDVMCDGRIDDRDHIRKWYGYTKKPKWTYLIPVEQSRRGFKQIYFYEDFIRDNIAGMDLWTFCICAMLMPYSVLTPQPFGDGIWQDFLSCYDNDYCNYDELKYKLRDMNDISGRK